MPKKYEMHQFPKNFKGEYWRKGDFQEYSHLSHARLIHMWPKVGHTAPNTHRRKLAGCIHQTFIESL